MWELITITLPKWVYWMIFGIGILCWLSMMCDIWIRILTWKLKKMKENRR